MNSSNVSSPCPLLLEYFRVSFKSVYGPVGLAVCILSALINCCNIVVLSRDYMVTPTNRILLCIAVSDLGINLVILPHLVCFYLIELESQASGGSLRQWTIFFALTQYVALALHTLSVWLCVLLGIFRWFIIRYYPSYHVKRYFGVRRVGVAIGFALAAIVVLLAPYYASMSIIPRQRAPPAATMANSSDGRPEGAEGRNYTTYRLSGNKTDLRLFVLVGTFAKVVPSLLSLLFSGLILSSLRSANLRRKSLTQEGHILPSRGGRGSGRRRTTHRRTTCMLACIMFLFTAVELPQGILIVFFKFSRPVWCVYNSLGDFFDFMSLIKNITIFVLYCSMSTEYRRTCYDFAVKMRCHLRSEE